jgi:ankyrin repeat protein
MIVRLLQNGADANSMLRRTSRGHEYLAALVEAVRKNNFAVVKLLLDHGADPNITISKKWGVWGGLQLQAALRSGHVPIAKILRDAGAKDDDNDDNRNDAYEPFTIIVEANDGMKYAEDLSTLKIPFSTALPDVAATRGAEIEATPASQVTVAGERIGNSRGDDSCLTGAIRTSNLDLVELFLDRGDDPNAVNYQQQYCSPCLAAARRGNVAILELLIRRGANPDVSYGLPHRRQRRRIRIFAALDRLTWRNVDFVELGR